MIIEVTSANESGQSDSFHGLLYQVEREKKNEMNPKSTKKTKLKLNQIKEINENGKTMQMEDSLGWDYIMLMQ